MAPASPPPQPPSTGQALEQLDRLEDLLELMDELNVSTRAEAEALLAKLEAETAEDAE